LDVQQAFRNYRKKEKWAMYHIGNGKMGKNGEKFFERKGTLINRGGKKE